ncbi:MAG: hypothetical protein DME12_15980 [Candidatus Rokuibacteriota bacterium]|nr:MAG: hypothetical protein DME12_15980 [Candidatus Rokubacteria bacterium]
MVTLHVNGKAQQVDVTPDTPLLWALRDVLGLTGTKFGCGIALCGACTVHLDGQPTRACITPVSAAAQRKITTVEGIGADRVGKAVQTAWVEVGVPQCGYCQAGQVMSATALLKQNPKPTDADIDAAMSGNICRCGTYTRIRAAIREPARLSRRSLRGRRARPRRRVPGGPARGRPAQVRKRRNARRLDRQPPGVPRHRRGRHGHDRLSPFRDGAGRPHRNADDRGR